MFTEYATISKILNKNTNDINDLFNYEKANSINFEKLSKTRSYKRSMQRLDLRKAYMDNAKINKYADLQKEFVI